MPAQLVEHANRIVSSWARTGGQNLNELSFREWFPMWLGMLSSFMIAFICLVGVIHSMYWSYLAITVFTKKRSFYSSWPFVFTCIIILAGTVTWLWYLPDPRFGFGFTIFTVLLFFSILLKELLSVRVNQLFCISLLIYLLATSGIDSIIVNLLLKSNSVFYKKPNQTQLSEMEAEPVQLVGSGKINVLVNSDDCWNTALPCTPYQPIFNNMDLQQRGISISQGYKYK
jgi:hypothetical protein